MNWYNENDSSFIVIPQENDSELLLKNISPKNSNSKVMIKFEFESNCFNCLRIYYKILNEKSYSENKYLYFYYYKNETINHCLIFPDEI